MNRITTQRRVLLAAGLAPLLAPRLSRAQSAYPGNRTVSLVIPYAAGGIPDVFGNAITQGLQERLGGTFIMEH
ncbi:MAG TPA: tripartite tricarboxylate transporter substrate binding protein, partial [Roseomonas sp.]|nr:tripartite tricarboxylate transporter substrate binding protein [Roseomonas sp.]